MKARSAIRAATPGIALLMVLAAALPAQSQSAARVEWQPQWQTVQPIEYAATVTFAAGTIAMSLLVDPRTSGGRGGLFFDAPIRDALRARTRSGRDAARFVGDTGFRTMLLFPWLDAALTWAVHGNGQVAWQMFAMDAEALAFAGLVGVLTDHLIGRARPSEPECAKNPGYERFCNQPDEFSSFLSGHSVIAAAGAGVTCAHHLSMPLYGGGAGDIAVCAAASALALTTGIARIVNDRHWATDVTVALMVGGLAGYGWHKWFHYRVSPVPDHGDAGLHMMLLPLIAPDRISGSVIGQF